MRILAFTAALTAAAFLHGAARAETPAMKEMACPIGGKKFSHVVPASSTSRGTRPDGKPYGSREFPNALPECPDNGLVMFKDYTAEEVAVLEPLVASEEYQSLRGSDTPYYRAYRLMKKLGRPAQDTLWVLLQASWQADAKPELRARYLKELVEASATVPARPDDLNWIGMEGRAINALRELGRFDEARARLARLSLASLDVTVPAGLADSQSAVRSARNRRAWLTYFRSLAIVIGRGDASLEPFDMIPPAIALGRCLSDPGKLGVEHLAFCETDAAKAGIERLRSSRPAAEGDAEVLKRSREEAGR